MKTELEAASMLAAFEAQCEAYTFRVRGVSIWRLLRTPVGYALQDLPLSSPPLGLFNVFITTIRSLIAIVRLRPQTFRYVVKSYTSALSVKGELGWTDVYFDELLDHVPGGIRLTTKNTPVKKTMSSVLSSSLDCTAIHALGAVMAYLSPIKEGDPMFNRLATELDLHLGVRGFSAQRIRRLFSSFWWQSRMFEWLLSRLSPQTVIISDSGERAMIAACRRCGVRLIELQHGVFTQNDPDCLPVAALIQADENALLLPDILALHGDYWVARHRETAMGQSGRLRAVGVAVIDRYRAERERQFHSDSNCLELVLTTQGLAREELICFLRDFLRGTIQPFRLSIKLHPVFDLSPDPYIAAFKADPRVRVLLDEGEQNTYQLIAHADLHISIASASHFDAIGIGCPTVVLNLAGSNVVEDLAATGCALYAETPSDLIAIVQGRDWTRLKENSPEMYFRRDFVTNMSQLIR